MLLLQKLYLKVTVPLPGKRDKGAEHALNSSVSLGIAVWDLMVKLEQF